MPNGAFLYADELLGALANKSAAGGFRDMVLYIEACESGSIFEARAAPPLGPGQRRAARPAGAACPRSRLVWRAGSALSARALLAAALCCRADRACELD
jgi:hypothetical protein